MVEERHFSRRCLGCGKSAQKSELWRFVIAAGQVVFDGSGRMPGRGAYLHAQRDCLARAGEVGRWKHAFRTAQAAGDERLDGRLLHELLARMSFEFLASQDPPSGVPPDNGAKKGVML